MALTLANIGSRILRNVQIPEDSSTTSIQALSDAKQFANEWHHRIWGRRLWRESIILGSFSVPAGTQVVALSDIVVDSRFTAGSGFDDAFTEISAVREGDNPLLAEDATAIHAIDPAAWASTTSPTLFINRGQKGIYLLGKYSSATTLSFFGKAMSQDLSDSESWALDSNGWALILGATGDFIKHNERDDERAQLRYAEADAEVQKLIDQQEVQGANRRRIVPVNPWTNYDISNAVDISKTGTGSINF